MPRRLYQHPIQLIGRSRTITCSRPGTLHNFRRKLAVTPAAPIAVARAGRRVASTGE